MRSPTVSVGRHFTRTIISSERLSFRCAGGSMDGASSILREMDDWRRLMRRRWRSEIQKEDIPFRPILSFAITSIILELRGLHVSSPSNPVATILQKEGLDGDIRWDPRRRSSSSTNSRRSTTHSSHSLSHHPIPIPSSFSRHPI